MNTQNEYTVTIGDKKLTAQFADIADQAHGSVLLRYGDTVVLATAVMSDRDSSANYFPLSVEYEEKFYAAGQILGSRFMRREGRPSEEAVLSGRAIDRTLRPLFDHRMRHDVQVVITVLSIGEDDPDVLAINAASLALATSDIPWGGPVAAVRLGKQNGTWDINPTYKFRDSDDTRVDLLACGRNGLINMIEVGAHEVSEDVLVEGLEQAVTELNTIEDFQKNIVSEIGKEKREVKIAEVSPEAQELFEKSFAPEIDKILFAKDTYGKDALKKLEDKWQELLDEKLPDENTGLAMALLDEEIDKAVHRGALERDERVDGRKLDEVRTLSAHAGGISDILHGSGTFYRGGTHVLSVLTLGGPSESLIVDTIETQDSQKRFLHHYNFPPFSVGETGRIGGFNRRMIGHGALAEKALIPAIPSIDDFPYTIRIVSEALASNGSTSMASVCASTLALMDAGVPITKPIAGIAMGLMSNGAGDGEKIEYKMLTDIQGPEDHHGDMDLKVAGSQDGVTAVQMDVKVQGVTTNILKEAFAAARVARETILGVITSAIPEPRNQLKETAPRVIRMSVPTDKLGTIIGGGGKTIKGIQEETNSQVDIEDDGTIYITSKGTGAEKAEAIIAELIREPEVGERYDEAEVTRITDFGAFVRISRNHEGLVHISELAPFRINKVSDVVSVGDKVPVIIKEIDELHRVNLSLKDADPDFAKRKGIKPAESTEQRGGEQPRKSE